MKSVTEAEIRGLSAFRFECGLYASEPVNRTPTTGEKKTGEAAVVPVHHHPANRSNQGGGVDWASQRAKCFSDNGRLI
jgi:hypothetical protein